MTDYWDGDGEALDRQADKFIEGRMALEAERDKLVELLADIQQIDELIGEYT